METLLVRLKPYDHRRGHVLRRYTYAGIKFQVDRGWSRVEKPVADYLRAVRQIPGDTERRQQLNDIIAALEAQSASAS